MSVPILANYRANFRYTVDGLTHQIRHFCGASAGSGSTGYNITFRDGTAGVDFHTVVDAFWNIWQATLDDSKSAVGPATLEQYSGGAWIPVASYTSTGTLTGSGTYNKAVQMSAFFRDDQYKPVKVIWLEQAFAAGQKSTALSSGTLGTPLLKYITQPSTGTPDPWNWVLSRGGRPVKSFTSWVTDLNDRVRRARGIA